MSHVVELLLHVALGSTALLASVALWALGIFTKRRLLLGSLLAMAGLVVLSRISPMGAIHAPILVVIVSMSAIIAKSSLSYLAKRGYVRIEAFWGWMVSLALLVWVIVLYGKASQTTDYESLGLIITAHEFSAPLAIGWTGVTIGRTIAEARTLPAKTRSGEVPEVE